MSDFLWPHGLQPTRLLHPWDFPGKNTGVGCHFHLQGIFLTQGSNSGLLHWQAGCLLLSHLGSPLNYYKPSELFSKVVTWLFCKLKTQFLRKKCVYICFCNEKHLHLDFFQHPNNSLYLSASLTLFGGYSEENKPVYSVHFSLYFHIYPNLILKWTKTDL